MPVQFPVFPAVCVIAVGGLDPSGGAGLVRDFVTAEACGAQAQLVGSAFTVQSPGGVAAVEARPALALQSALRHALARAPTGKTAVKFGMLADPEAVDAALGGLDGFLGPIVHDPVLAASSGGALFTGPPEALLPLVRRATLVTPNLGEAAALTHRAVATLEEARAAAGALLAAGARAVLVKGGHLEGDAVDVLATQSGERLLSAPRLPGPSPRGTGCALATAIATALAAGAPLEEAVAAAKAWLSLRIRAAALHGEERFLGSGRDAPSA